jgi:hypothetical protein
MRRNPNGFAVCAQKQAERLPVQQIVDGDQAAADQEIERNSGQRDLCHAIPAFGADVLCGHRRDRRSNRHCRHLNVIPKLHRGVECGSLLRSESIHERGQREHAGRNDEHLQSHRNALRDQQAHQSPIDPEQTPLVAMNAQGVLGAIQMHDERDETDCLRGQRRNCGPCDSESRNRPPAKISKGFSRISRNTETTR